MKSTLRDPASLLGAALVVLFLLLCAAGNWIAPFPADATGAIHFALKLKPPSALHWFGTDEMGDDIFSRVVIGARTSLWVGVAITGVAVAIGAPLGIAAGFLGGRTQTIIMRLTDVFLCVPGLVLALAIVAALGPGLGHGVAALAAVWWPGYVRLLESKALALREATFVEAARAGGASTLRILLRHVAPNCTGPLIVKASMDMGFAILAAASLGFIGLGARPPAPEWGAMMAVARNYMPGWWWYSLAPGAFVFATVLGFNLLGDGLASWLDPHESSR